MNFYKKIEIKNRNDTCTYDILKINKQIQVIGGF